MAEEKMTKKKMSKASKNAFLNYGIVLAFFVIFQVLSSTGILSNSLKGQLIPVVSYMIMAVSLNLVVGISGELSLGHAGFMSIGAFTGVVVEAVILSNSPAAATLSKNLGLQILILVASIVAGAIIAGVAGVLIGIPVLRLNGDYLAIVTLAFGEIIKNLLYCLYIYIYDMGLHFSLDPTALTGTTVLNGPMGATSIKKISIFAAGVVLLLIVLVIVQNLVNSRSGRAIMAIRDNRIAAEASGLHITKYKMMAFVTSAALAGAAGALYALNYSTIVPKKFDFNTSILILVFVVLGGIGNMTGALIAAAVLTVLPEMLREFQDYRMLVYAIVLILVMLLTNNERVKAFLAGLFNKKNGKTEAKEVA